MGFLNGGRRSQGVRFAASLPRGTPRFQQPFRGRETVFFWRLRSGPIGPSHGRAAKFQASFSLSVTDSGARRSIALSCDPIPLLYASGKGCSPGPSATRRAAACAPKTLPPARCGMNGAHGDGTHRSKSLPQIERSRRYELRSNRTNGSRIFQSKWGSGIQGWRVGR